MEPAYISRKGTAVEVQDACPGDLDAVRNLYRGMFSDNLYLRFFRLGPWLADEVAVRLRGKTGPGRAAGARPIVTGRGGHEE